MGDETTPKGRSDNPFSSADDNSHGQNFDWFREAFDPETSRYASDKLASVHMPMTVNNTDRWASQLAQGMDAGPRANPYDMGLGNQARDGYMAALDQLHNGTSVVGGQANQAMGNLAGQVSGATANTSSGLGQALASGVGAQGAGAIAGQAGDARLKEFMNQQAQYSGGMNALRGQDLSQASDFQDAGLKQRGQDDVLNRFYNDQNAQLDAHNKDMQLNGYKLWRRMDLDKQKKNQQTGTDVGQVVGSLLKMLGIGI